MKSPFQDQQYPTQLYELEKEINLHTLFPKLELSQTNDLVHDFDQNDNNF